MGRFEDRLVHRWRAPDLVFGVFDCTIAEDGTLTIFEVTRSFPLAARGPAAHGWEWGCLEDANEATVTCPEAREEPVQSAGRRPRLTNRPTPVLITGRGGAPTCN